MYWRSLAKRLWSERRANYAAAYGTGARPIISAGSNQYAIKLFNQQYWKIENIETTGGTRYGIFVGGDISGVLNYIRLTNLSSHDVGGPTTNLGSIICVGGATNTSKFNDVVIDNVTAYETTQWNGIQVGECGVASVSYTDARNTNITVRNSTVHDVQSNGR